MNHQAVEEWRHSHNYSVDFSSSERKTQWVVLLTAVMMVIEISAGYLFGSMALLADGWHMGTHVAALAITLFAYNYARKHAENPRFSFGTGKVTALGGYTSAIALAMVALLMGVESLNRFFNPETIHFHEAIFVASIGLIVNLVSAWLLHGGGDHHHGHDHGHHHHEKEGDNHHHHHHDHNLKAAYLHVVADALTSLLAIVALIAGMYLGWVWMDAAMGIVGAILITKWAVGLLRQTSQVLLDSTPTAELSKKICTTIEADADNQVVDLHIWEVGPQKYGCIISLITHIPQNPTHYKDLLHHLSPLKHITIEVNRCHGEDCKPSETS
ncbi:MAG: CDF family Co(II)/Ni(II) efflux transporter DmeF [Gammaproteobacteria bacterium]|nr:CDF family Co(II)/Ni(II) efflux transporter DmeF [Gammaproteobacteria bacterium]